MSTRRVSVLVVAGLISCGILVSAGRASAQGSTSEPAPSGAQPPDQSPAQPPGSPPAQAPDQPPAAPPAAGSKIFNPDIAVIGNFIGVAGTNHVDPDPVLALRESEISFQAIVDPYARADFFFSFGDEGAEVEEGFITFPTLPGGLLVKVGRMREAFGKINTLHSHVLPWPDRPLVTKNLLGGEEGLRDDGVSVAGLIRNPWVFLEATGQVFKGDAGEGTIFHSSERSDVSLVGRLRGYGDLSESTNVDVGVSYARGHNGSGVVDAVDEGRFTTTLMGIDATVRWRPLRRSIYRSFIGRSEIVWSRREQPVGPQHADGFFVSGDYQFARRWFAGVRLDRSERAANANARDTGQSVVVTFWPSEFSQVRGQYRRTRYAEGPVANEFLFQFQFSIGAHGAHPF